MDKTDTLPRDAQSILELAGRSMFELFANASASEGMMLVDRQARVVWRGTAWSVPGETWTSSPRTCLRAIA